jgi:hypothetical protein
MRDAIRPTTSLRGPESVGPRQLLTLLACWVLWYLAASLALNTMASRLEPTPPPGVLP